VQQADVTTATDVYALGVLLYQLLGGRHPTADDTQTHLDRLRAVVDLVPKRLSDVARDQLDPVIARQAKLLRGDLDTIVGKALKKKPGERYANAESMAVDLRHWLAHEPITARPDTRLYVLGRFVRRHRWSVAASSVAVLAMVSLTGLSVLQARRAERAEHQAQERRQQADDLLSYMLGEFADKLRPVGRLELLDSVGSKALTYLAQDDNATPEERLQRAKALTVIGEVRVSKRNLKDALEPLEAASRLLSSAPPSKELSGAWFKAQGAAAFWTGHVYYYTRELEKAASAWLEYRDAEQAWVDAEPTNREALVELSYAYNSLGTARLNMVELAEATTYFKRSIELKKRNIDADSKPDPKALMEYADSLSWLGNVLMQQGLERAAERLFSQGTDVIASARKTAPDDNLWLYREAIMRRWRSDALARMGRIAEAREELQVTLTMLKRLTLVDPSNTQWRLNLLTVEVNDFVLSADRMSPAERVEAARTLHRQWEQYGSEVPKSSGRTLESRARVLTLLARALVAQGKAEAGVQLLDAPMKEQAAALSTRATDLTFIASYVDTRRTLMEIAAASPRSVPPAVKAAACKEIDDATMKMDRAIRVHQQITQAWVEAQSCLGKGDREDVKQAASWLLRDRTAELPP
jgi:eukaryotic-like serine/threonine-protein kinase